MHNKINSCLKVKSESFTYSNTLKYVNSANQKNILYLKV